MNYGRVAFCFLGGREWENINASKTEDRLAQILRLDAILRPECFSTQSLLAEDSSGLIFGCLGGARNFPGFPFPPLTGPIRLALELMSITRK
jgi:hypothetical protein